MYWCSLGLSAVPREAAGLFGASDGGSVRGPHSGYCSYFRPGNCEHITRKEVFVLSTSERVREARKSLATQAKEVCSFTPHLRPICSRGGLDYVPTGLRDPFEQMPRKAPRVSRAPITCESGTVALILERLGTAG